MLLRTTTGRAVSRALIAAVFLAAGLIGPVSAAAQVTLEGRAGWFLPSSGDFRGSYGGGVVPGIGLSFEIARGLSIWAGADLFSRTGALTFTEEEVKIRITSAFAGLKYSLGRASVRPYIGAAAGFWSYKETSGDISVSGSDPGFLGQVGVDVRMSGKLSLDLYGKYGHCLASPDDEDAVKSQIGGLTFGAGLSYRF